VAHQRKREISVPIVHNAFALLWIRLLRAGVKSGAR
jgi:hypothetical protein